MHKGNTPQNSVRLCGRKGVTTLITTTEQPPKPAARTRDPVDVAVTLLLQGEKKIEREKATTPTRNAEGEEWRQMMREVRRWGQRVYGQMVEVMQMQRDHGYDLR